LGKRLPATLWVIVCAASFYLIGPVIGGVTAKGGAQLLVGAVLHIPEANEGLS
jgi:hypothetical protein